MRATKKAIILGETMNDPSNVLSEEEFDEYVQEYIEENY